MGVVMNGRASAESFAQGKKDNKDTPCCEWGVTERSLRLASQKKQGRVFAIGILGFCAVFVVLALMIIMSTTSLSEYAQAVGVVSFVVTGLVFGGVCLFTYKKHRSGVPAYLMYEKQEDGKFKKHIHEQWNKRWWEKHCFPYNYCFVRSYIYDLQKERENLQDNFDILGIGVLAAIAKSLADYVEGRRSKYAAKFREQLEREFAKFDERHVLEWVDSLRSMEGGPLENEEVLDLLLKQIDNIYAREQREESSEKRRDTLDVFTEMFGEEENSEPERVPLTDPKGIMEG